MIKLLGKIPKEDFYIACSGGVDSMVALDFFMNGGYRPIVAYFNHGTDYGEEACEFVRSQCHERSLRLVVEHIGRDKKKEESTEEYWRNERYSFFSKLSSKLITAHHLDDAIEWWLFSSMHGKSRLIPYQNGNVIRPLLLTPKQKLIDWANKRKISYLEDPSNKEDKYMRNYIREYIIPHALKVNPGFRKVIRKKLESQGTIINRIDQKPEVSND